ncbi:hypothetical protein LCM00_03480 [Bacillus infantis]|uniref:hypothetical protein n=1 Tax=Bacillus infantis TaxID=324767 RepID=UPI001CD4E807|nr:hypothetical protein [Bacillus infantis]MCA1038561.1 hypothetical protein [Bacillus infantis]
MSEYIEMEDEEIIYHVYNLNWHLSKETQKEAADVLFQLPAEKVGMIIPKYGKACWENGVAVIRKIGYPRNEKALPRLAGLLQDRNWPGALDAVEIFRELGKEISTPYIERECEEAIRCGDHDWLEHLYYAVESLGLEPADLRNGETYEEMRQRAEELREI